MRRFHQTWCLGGLLLLGGLARGEDGAAPPAENGPVVRAQQPSSEKPPVKPKEKEPDQPPPAVARETPQPPPQTGLPARRRSQPLPMWGDQPPRVGPGPGPGPGPVPLPIPAPPGAPPVIAVLSAVPVPSLRAFKIADHESPAPLDRAYVAFNFFNDVSAATNRGLDSDVHGQRVYRETFGLEKTLFDERASVGLRLPLNTLTGDSDIPGLGGSSTDFGDLSIILKYAAWRSCESGDLVSVGLAVTAPTGPDAFAGSHQVTPLHSTTLQPFVGYIFNWGDFYLHGFTSIDVPTDSRDVTILYDDVGVGYHLYRAADPDQWLTGVVPTFEVHVNTPLNHRGSLRPGDAAGTPDVVDLTLGTWLEFGDRAKLGAAVVAPVTGPRPFDVEAIVHFELRF
jgi:hypothetical protein